MTRTQARLLIVASATIMAALIAGGLWWVLQGTSVDAAGPTPDVVASAPAKGSEGPHIDVDRSARDAVALAAAKILTTWDPSVDDTEAAAVHRAQALLSTKVFDRNTTAVRSGSAGLWMDMASKGATSFPHVEVQDDPHSLEERPNADALTVLARWEWNGPSFRKTNPDTRMFFMQMQQNDQGQWEVGDYTYTDVPSSYLGNEWK